MSNATWIGLHAKGMCFNPSHTLTGVRAVSGTARVPRRVFSDSHYIKVSFDQGAISSDKATLAIQRPSPAPLANVKVAVAIADVYRASSHTPDPMP